MTLILVYSSLSETTCILLNIYEIEYSKSIPIARIRYENIFFFVFFFVVFSLIQNCHTRLIILIECYDNGAFKSLAK